MRVLRDAPGSSSSSEQMGSHAGFPVGFHRLQVSYADGVSKVWWTSPPESLVDRVGNSVINSGSGISVIANTTTSIIIMTPSHSLHDNLIAWVSGRGALLELCGL